MGLQPVALRGVGVLHVYTAEGGGQNSLVNYVRVGTAAAGMSSANDLRVAAIVARAKCVRATTIVARVCTKGVGVGAVMARARCSEDVRVGTTMA